MADTALYSTIATIIGVWMSIVISSSLVLLTYIINQNTHFFTSVRNEKIKLYPSFKYLINDSGLVTRRASCSKNRVENEFSEALNSIESICAQPDYEIIKRFEGDVADIYEDIKKIILCYPSFVDIGSIFLFTEKLPINDSKYESWIIDYKERIDISNINKIFKELNLYFDFTKQKWLDDDTESMVSTLTIVMDKLRIIDRSIDEIETLKRDYQPIVAILEILKSKSATWSILGTLFFGILLPVYMLLPQQFNLISEIWLIIVIFAGLFVCYCVTISKMKQIIGTIHKD